MDIKFSINTRKHTEPSDYRMITRQLSEFQDFQNSTIRAL